jgi:hypothetical protein
MKLISIFLLTICVGIITINAKHHHKNVKQDNLSSPVIRTGGEQNTPKQISETFYGGNPNTLPKDRSFLWNDFHKNQYAKPYMHGVVGPQWKVPVAEDDTPYNYVSSPHPEPNYNHRIVPHDLPQRTHSHNSFEMPKRKDVVQIDLPYGVTRTREKYFDPRMPLKVPVAVVSGTQYHNTGSVTADQNMANNMEATAAGPQTLNTQLNFAEKKHTKKNLGKKHKNHDSGLSNDDVKRIKVQSLDHAKVAEIKAARMLHAMTPHPEAGESTMALDIKLTNKREHDFELHRNNAARQETIEYLKGKGIGIRALHTKPFLPSARFIN